MASIFGDVTKISTTGASAKTASQDKLSGGVEASHKMAENDLKRIDNYKTIILRVGKAKQMDPAVIAAIISRESRGGSQLTPEGYEKGGGKGFGLMQVDTGYHTKRGAWNSEEHITQGTEILIDFIKKIQKDYPTWPKDHQFKGGIASYNRQPKKDSKYEDVDDLTTGKDYSNDVVARAQWFKRHGY